MIVRIESVLGVDEVRHCREVLERGEWVDGRVTAGSQSVLSKRNRQLAETSSEATALGGLILGKLATSARFMSAALPARVVPPLFNRYEPGMEFGGHIDNAVRYAKGDGAYRTDISCTVFLSDPESYDGGELVIEGGMASTRVKFPAGDAVLYPATTVHRVEPVTRGARWASFFWIQSMIRDSAQRTLLHEMDQAIALTRKDLGDDNPAVISLTGAYHNLIRMWADL